MMNTLRGKLDVRVLLGAAVDVLRFNAALSAEKYVIEAPSRDIRPRMECYVDFWQVTEAALRFAVRRLSIVTTDSQLERLMGAYLNPAAFDEARSALEALEGSALAILSNGSRRMLDSAVRNNGLESYFAEIVSADMVEDLQTVSSRIRPWTRTPESLHAPEILFVSSNLWDAAGAKAFGYPVCWCNRSRSRNGRLGVCSRFYGASA